MLSRFVKMFFEKLRHYILRVAKKIVPVVMVWFVFVKGNYGQSLFFQLVHDDKVLEESVLPVSSEEADSQTSCYLSCMNHQECCVVQIKDTLSKLACKFYSLLNISSFNVETQNNSQILSVVDTTGRCYADSCFEWFKRGFRKDGVYDIYINGKSKTVFCDMTKNGGGWTLFQRRIDGAVDFEVPWNAYKNGFGDVGSEFWLGNDFLHEITNGTTDTLIRIEATDFGGESKFIIFKGFWIEDESKKYKLHTGNYEDGVSALGIDWKSHDLMSFSTSDQDSDKSNAKHCAQQFHQGFWFKKCYNISPNGPYSTIENIGAENIGIVWRQWLKKTARR